MCCACALVAIITGAPRAALHNSIFFHFFTLGSYMDLIYRVLFNSKTYLFFLIIGLFLNTFFQHLMFKVMSKKKSILQYRAALLLS